MPALLIPSLFLSFHLTVFALTLPLNLTADWTILSDVNALNSEAHCPPEPPTTPLLPLVQDCIRAIRLLPHSPYIGTFHIGGYPSIFQLPVSEDYESCTVTVLLHEDFDQELGSWGDIRIAAVQLLRACELPDGETGDQRTGGWITTGAENGLVIELRRSRGVSVNKTRVGPQRGSNGVDVE